MVEIIKMFGVRVVVGLVLGFASCILVAPATQAGCAVVIIAVMLLVIIVAAVLSIGRRQMSRWRSSVK